MGSTVASYRPTKVSTDRTRQAPRTLPQPSWLLLIVITATVAGLVWGLMQQRRPEIDPRQVIAINLAAGELAFKHERYLEPADHSAAHYFNAVLSLDPDQPRALRGLEQISEHFADLAKIAILDSRFADAAVAIEQVRRLKIDDRRLGLLEIELRKALDTHVAMLAAITARPGASTDKAPAQTAAVVDQHKSINAQQATGQDSTRTAAATTRKAPVKAEHVDGSVPSSARDTRIAASGGVASAPSMTANQFPRTDLEDELAEEQLAATLTSRTEARVDGTQIQPPIREQGSIATPSTINVEQPLPAPAAQMAATTPPLTPPATPIEVSARWLPTAIKLVEPHYPDAAQVRGLEGWVDLMLTVAPTGEVIDAQVRDREGSRSFERAALLAVRQWRYEPNAAGSAAPALEIPVRVAFKLE